MSLSEILEKLKEFKVLNLKIEEDIVKLQIEAIPGENLNEKERYINLLLQNYKTEIVFIVKKEPVKKIKKIFAICSGKGGVGKSTTAINLAFALKEKNFKVGILDADIYTPSINFLLNNNNNELKSIDGQLIEPILVNGIFVISMGMLLKHNQALMWQASIVANTFRQLFLQTNWQVDYLIIDLPPGVSEIFEICKNIFTQIEFILITLPNLISYIDTTKLYILLKSYNLNVLGIVENNNTNVLVENENFKKLQEQYPEISLIKQVPFFKHVFEYSQKSYPINYKMKKEKEVFCEILLKIL